MMNRLKLTQGGDDCQCTLCKEGFATTEAFDRHRIGKYGRPGTRRCLDREGMKKADMVRTTEGLWREWHPQKKEAVISA